jgi:uncharacterized membrane protein YdjX (TVP38/TMEM64 family)
MPGHDPERPVGEALASSMVTSEETPLLLRWRVIAALVVAFVAVVGGYFIASSIWGFSAEIDAEPFRDWVEGWGALGPVVFIFVMAASVLFAPIPNVPVFIAAGLAWGPLLGTVYSLIGLMIGSTAAFWISRRLGRRWLPRLIGRHNASRIDALADSMGGRVLFLARMLPVVNFDWLSFVAGVTSIRYWVFAVASFFGMIVPTAAAVVAGDGLGRDLRITAAAIGAWLAVVLFTAAYYYWRRRRYMASRRGRESHAARVSRPAGQG